MQFKEPQMKDEFWSLKPKLRCILCDIEYYCWYKWGLDIVITSLMRLDNPKSPHYYGRGADLRSWTFTPEQRAEIKYYICTKYIYGDNQHETMIYHKTNSDDSAFHLHVQVQEIKVDGKL